MSRKGKKKKDSKNEQADAKKDGVKELNKENKENKENEENEEKRPGFLESITGAFSRPQMFNQFRKMNITSSLSFIAVFLLLIVFLYTLRVSYHAARSLDEIALYFEKDIPEITVRNGKASVDVDTPFIFKSGNPAEPVIIIDPGGDIKNLNDYQHALLITGTQAIYKESGVEHPPFDISQLGDIKINKETILEKKKTFLTTQFPIIIMFMYFFRAITLAIQVIIIAFMGFLFARHKAVSIPFRQFINVAIYASVPALLINAVLDIAGISGHFPAVVGMAIFYVVFVIYMIRGVDEIVRVETAAPELSADVEG